MSIIIISIVMPFITDLTTLWPGPEHSSHSRLILCIRMASTACSGHFNWHEQTSIISLWISKHMSSKVWNEITYPFPAPLKCGNGQVGSHALYNGCTVYPKKYAHGFVVLCFVVVMQSFIMNSHEVFIHIHQGCFAGTGAIVRLPQCQWSKPDGYG